MGHRSQPASEGGQPPLHRGEGKSRAGEDGPALPLDAARAGMMRRQAALALGARITLFEALSADAAWARAAIRVR